MEYSDQWSRQNRDKVKLLRLDTYPKIIEIHLGRDVLMVYWIDSALE